VRGSENRTTNFREAAKATTQPVDAPEPQQRKRDSGEKDKGAPPFQPAAKPLTHRTARRLWRQRRALRYLADTLDWLNLWQEPDAGQQIGAEPTTNYNYPSPNL
jgi:hypothetical protein